jgi:hypothetical protein
MKVFVSSSWRNEQQPSIVRELTTAGHEVYDFRSPAPNGAAGFSWTDVDPDGLRSTPSGFREVLRDARVLEGFRRDMAALRGCDALVMVQPCGRSAALELGWAAGAGKATVVLLADGEPELMLKMADHFCLDVFEVLATLEEIDRPRSHAER